MIKETRTYTDYNGIERTEDFYFNLTKAELTELEASTPGGFKNYLDSIVDSKSVPEIIATFKKIILMSYGVKSPDGKRFIKNQELTDEFTQTEAYSDLFMELATDADKAATFINGVLPVVKEAPEIVAPNVEEIPEPARQPRIQPAANRPRGI